MSHWNAERCPRQHLWGDVGGASVAVGRHDLKVIHMEKSSRGWSVYKSAPEDNYSPRQKKQKNNMPVIDDLIWISDSYDS